MTHRGPFQPLPLCDSVKFRMLLQTAMTVASQTFLASLEVSVQILGVMILVAN